MGDAQYNIAMMIGEMWMKYKAELAQEILCTFRDSKIDSMTVDQLLSSITPMEEFNEITKWTMRAHCFWLIDQGLVCCAIDRSGASSGYRFRITYNGLKKVQRGI